MEGLTQHSESCHCHGEVACAGNGGAADVDARMLHLHVRDHQVPVPKDPCVEHINGLVVCLREQQKWVTRLLT